MSFTLKIENRKLKEKSNNQLRKNGFIPAVYYHKNKENIILKTSLKELKKALNSREPIIKLSNGKLAIIKEIQKDPVSQKILHISFEGVVKGEKFNQKVPLLLKYDENCQWKKEKLELRQVLTEIEIETTPSDLPENIQFDVSNLTIEKVLKIKDLMPIKGIKYLEDEDKDIAYLTKEKLIINEQEIEEKSQTDLENSNEKEDESTKKD